MSLTEIAARPEHYFLSVTGLKGDSTHPAHPGLLEVKQFAFGLDALQSSPSVYKAGYRPQSLTLTFATDEGMTFFIDKAEKGSLLTAASLFGGGAYGLEPGYLDSFALDLASLTVTGVSETLGGGYQVSLDFGSFEVATRNLAASGYLGPADTWGSLPNGTPTTLAGAPGANSAPLAHADMPTRFYLQLSGVNGNLSGGGLSGVFEVSAGSDGLYRPGGVGGKVSFTDLHVTLANGKVDLANLLAKFSSGAHISSGALLGYSANGQVYKLSLSDVVLTGVALGSSNAVGLDLAFSQVTWKTVDVSDSGAPATFTAVGWNVAANSSSGFSSGAASSIPADFTPTVASASSAANSFFVSVPGWVGDSVSTAHANLFAAALVNLPSFARAYSAAIGGTSLGAIQNGDVLLAFTSPDAVAQFADALARGLVLSSLTIYEGVTSPAFDYQETMRFDLANARVTSMGNSGGFSTVSLSYTAYEATVLRVDAQGNPLPAISWGADNAGNATTVTDAPAFNGGLPGSPEGPTAFYIQIPGLTGNIDAPGLTGLFALTGFNMGGNRDSGGTLRFGDISVVLTDGVLGLAKLLDVVDRGVLLSTSTIYGDSEHGQSYKLSLSAVNITSLQAKDGSVVATLHFGAYTLSTVNFDGGGQPVSQEQSGYNLSSATASGYGVVPIASVPAAFTPNPMINAAPPQQFFLSVSGWTGDSRNVLHDGLFAATAVSLPFAQHGIGSQPSAGDLVVTVASQDGLTRFADALARNSGIARVTLYGGGVYGAAGYQDSLQLDMNNVQVTSIKDDAARGYIVTLHYSRFDVTSRGVAADGTLGSWSPKVGFDYLANTDAVAGSAPASNLPDAGSAASPTAYFIQMSGVGGVFATPDTTGLVGIDDFVFGAWRSGTALSVSDVTVTLGGSTAAISDFAHLLTTGAHTASVSLLGYTFAGQVYRLGLSDVVVTDLTTDSSGKVQVALHFGAYAMTSVDLDTQFQPVSQTTSGFNSTTSVATPYASSALSTIPAPYVLLNNPPVAANDFYQADGVLTAGAAAGLFANDSDPDGQALLTAVVEAGPSHGAIITSPGGGFVYTPDAGFSGVDLLTYHAVDVFGAASDFALVKLEVYLPGATAAADTITGTSGADWLRGLGGDDVIDGGGGTDTVGYTGARADYSVTWISAGVYRISDNRGGVGLGPDGSDMVSNAEVLHFTDQDATLVELTSGVDTVKGSGVNITATSTTLTSGDILTPSGAGNVLALSGGGAFNLGKAKTLSNIAIVTATEGAGTALPIITLRKGVNVTLNLATGTGVGSGAKVMGALDSSTINLGGGADVVTLGSATETVHGGSGKDTFNVNAVTIGATIDGGTGASTLNVTGGGTVVMGPSITNIKAVTLATATSFTANGLNLKITGSTGIDTIQAGPGTQTLTGRGGADTLISGAGADTFKDTIANLDLTTIQGFKPGDTIDVSNLKPSKTLPTTAAWAAGVLTVNEGATTVLIKLPGAFTGAFTTGSDGATGTAIHYIPPPGGPQPAGLAQQMASLGAGSDSTGFSLSMSRAQLPLLLAAGH